MVKNAKILSLLILLLTYMTAMKDKAKVPSRDMRKFICRLWLNKVNQQ